MGDLFGGSTSTSKPKDLTPPEFTALRGPFADVIKQLLGQAPGNPLTGIPSFGAATGQPNVAPIGANEQTLLDRLMSEGAGRTDLLNQTLGGQFLPGQSGTNPFLQAAIEAAQRPTFQGLEEVLSRTLPGRFTQGGQFVQPQGSSAFDRAAAIASRGASQAAADIATNLSFGVHEAERGRQQEAIGLSQAEVETSIQNLQAQALPRLIQDLGIERGMAEFQSRIQAILQALQLAGGAAAPVVANEGKSTEKPNIIGTLLGPVNAALGNR